MTVRTGAAKQIRCIRLKPSAQAGQWKGEQALDFGAIERSVRRSWRAGKILARGRFNAWTELRPTGGDESSDIPAGQSLVAGEMIKARFVLRDEFPDRSRRDGGRHRTAEFIGEKFQCSAGLPGAAHLFVETAIAPG